MSYHGSGINKSLWTYEKIEKSLLQSSYSHLNKRIPEIILEILHRRGIKSEDDFALYFNSELKNLKNPFEIVDMQRTVERIYQAITNKEKIFIYGDYDVDGVSSAALMFRFFKSINYEVSCYIPNREEEGYGLNTNALDKISKAGCNLLITVDCGISNYKEIEYASKELKIDVVVTDHHTVSSNYPNFAYSVVNPMRPENPPAYKNLSGVGVAFKVIVALRHYLRFNGFFESSGITTPNLKNLMDMVALGTVADIMPLTGENRVIVKHGLEVLAKNKNKEGLDALIQISNLRKENLTAGSIGFHLGPKINAAGRIGDPYKGFQLLISEDKEGGEILAKELNDSNLERQRIEKDILEESIDFIESNNLHEKYKGLVVYSDLWHAGVLGIIASRLVERYNKPVLALTKGASNKYKGSGRSTQNFNLIESLGSLSHLLENFGGHKYAAGLQILDKNIQPLQEAFHKDIDIKLPLAEDFYKVFKVDAELKAEDLNSDLIYWLKLCEPFGSKNSTPLFLIKGATLTEEQEFFGRGDHKIHMKANFTIPEYSNKIFTIGFNFKGKEHILSVGKMYDLIVNIDYNRDTNFSSSTFKFILKEIYISGKSNGEA